MKIKKTLYWLIGIFMFCGWVDLVWGQTYTEGDYVDDFGADICYNGDGSWSWEEHGFNKVTWISSFATW